MKRIIFLATMLLFLGIAKATQSVDIEQNVSNVSFECDIGDRCEYVDVQSYTCYVAIEPVKLCFCRVKDIVFHIPESIVFYDVGLEQTQVTQVVFDVIDIGLKPPEILIPQISTITLNYFTENRTNKKHRYRCGNNNDWGYKEYSTNFKT